MPLLIGGATTSRQHTAVKIAPEYARARRCTCSTRRARSASWRRCSTDKQRGRVRSRRTARSRSELRELHADGARSRCCRSPRRAANRLRIEWRAEDAGDAGLLGRARSIERAARARSSQYIDWTFFFTAWELKGRSRRSSSTRSTARRRAICTTSAQALLDADRRREAADARAASTASGRRTREGDDIVLFADAARAREVARFHMLRQQQAEDRRRAAPVARRFRRAGGERRCATTSARSP